MKQFSTPDFKFLDERQKLTQLTIYTVFTTDRKTVIYVGTSEFIASVIAKSGFYLKKHIIDL